METDQVTTCDLCGTRVKVCGNTTKYYVPVVGMPSFEEFFKEFCERSGPGDAPAINKYNARLRDVYEWLKERVNGR